MSQEIESKLEKIPVVKQLVFFTKSIKLPWLEGLSLYELLEMYLTGIIKGAISYRAGAIAFSFFMAIFPFTLFILNLIPFIPIENFQDDFLRFLEDSVPPSTYGAIAEIINDIMHNSYGSLLSSGFILSIFLMANGLNAILGGFESSHHVVLKRGFFNQYLISIGISIGLSFLLILTVATIVVFEVFIQNTSLQDVLGDSIQLIVIGRYVFVMLMILVTTSILFKFGTRESRESAFVSIGSVFTTILIIISSYIFGIWVVKFSKYNELYGSIGTLLILMFYIWLNCMILLLGFELNATIQKLKRRNLFAS